MREQCLCHLQSGARPLTRVCDQEAGEIPSWDSHHCEDATTKCSIASLSNTPDNLETCSPQLSVAGSVGWAAPRTTTNTRSERAIAPRVAFNSPPWLLYWLHPPRCDPRVTNIARGELRQGGGEADDLGTRYPVRTRELARPCLLKALVTERLSRTDDFPSSFIYEPRGCKTKLFSVGGGHSPG